MCLAMPRTQERDCCCWVFWSTYRIARNRFLTRGVDEGDIPQNRSVHHRSLELRQEIVAELKG